MPAGGSDAAAVLGHYRPKGRSATVVAFATEVVAAVEPASADRAKALLFAATRLGAFGEAVGLELRAAVLLQPQTIERFVVTECGAVGDSTTRTIRANLRYLSRHLVGAPDPRRLRRDRAKTPYSDAELAGFLALARAQPTMARRLRAQGLVAAGAGAGLTGADLRGLRGSDVGRRDRAVVVDVRGPRPRRVPVLARFGAPLVEAAAAAGSGFVIGGADPARRNVTDHLVASLCGGAGLPRLELGRLRASWLVAVAQSVGVRALLDAAGLRCSQRLGDLIADLPAVDEDRAIALLGARP